MIRFMPSKQPGAIVRVGQKFYKVQHKVLGFVELFRYHPNRLPQGREHYASEERLWNRRHTKQNYILNGNSWMNTQHR